jgi:putative hemolysin
MFLGTAEAGVSVAWTSLTFAGFVIVAGQLVPRAVARRWPAGIAPFLLPVLRLTEVVTTPVIVVGRGVSRVFIKERVEAVPPPERDAIQDLLREGELEGVGEREESAIISGVVEFSEKIVAQVMTPRSDVFALPDGVDPHTLASQIAQSRYSRVPIYHNALDNIVGMVHAFDVIKAHGEMPDSLRPVAFATPNAPCNELLFRMLRERLHLAIVQEGDRTVGLVTLEDLLEELVGDIRDEHDEPEPPRDPSRTTQ